MDTVSRQWTDILRQNTHKHKTKINLKKKGKLVLTFFWGRKAMNSFLVFSPVLYAKPSLRHPGNLRTHIWSLESGVAGDCEEGKFNSPASYMQKNYLQVFQVVRKTKLFIVQTTQEDEHITPNRCKVKNHKAICTNFQVRKINQEPTYQFTFTRMVKL